MLNESGFRSRVRRLLAVAGVATLAACSSSEEPIVVDRCNIRLADITPPSLILVQGDTSTLHATLLATADCLPPGTTQARLRWFSSDDSRATVDSVSGKVTAVATGSATISLRTTGYATTLASANVAVNVP